MISDVSYKKIWNIAFPIILGSIAQNIINVTDTAFLGRVGEIELGAAAIGGIFYLAFTMLAWGFGIGTQIIIARRLGEKKTNEIGIIFEHALYFLIAFSILIFCLIRFYSPFLIKTIIQSDNIINASNIFLRYRAFGIFFAFINFGFRSFYIGITKTKVISVTTIIMAIVNIILDYVLIFGKYGFPEMGIAGAALASVIAEITATIFFFAYTLRRINVKIYSLFAFSKFDFNLFYNIIKVSFPMMMQNFVSLSGWFLFFVFVEHLGEMQLAISNVIRSIYVVLMIPIWGFSSATNTLVSYFIGKKEYANVFKVTFRTIKLCLFSVFIIVAIFMIFPEKFLSIYSNNQELIALSIPVFYTVSAAALGISVGFILFNAVSGTGKTNISFLIECIIISIYLLATFYLTNIIKASIQVVWSLEYLYAFMLISSSYLYLKFGNWRKHSI